MKGNANMFTAAVITISDRSFRGERIDESGPFVAKLLGEHGYNITHTDLIPDEPEMIAAAIIKAADELNIALIITTGGTGFAPRDVTPEATVSVCTKMVPGIPEAMRMRGLKYTERSMLSRGTAGIRGQSLIINLPGSPKAAGESFEAVSGALEHGLVMLRERPMDCSTLEK